MEMEIVCQLSLTSCLICCTRRPKWELPENVQEIWPKYVGVVYNKYKNIVQLVGGEICIT